MKLWCAIVTVEFEGAQHHWVWGPFDAEADAERWAAARRGEYPALKGSIVVAELFTPEAS